MRAFDLLDELPVNVAVDRTANGTEAVQRIATSRGTDVVVFDFVHSAVLWPTHVPCSSVCFTHNVEAEIFARHAKKARNPFLRWMWSSQQKKMARFERESLARFTTVVAVSDRDRQFFSDTYGVVDVQAIPTGVDLDFFSWQEPPKVGRSPFPGCFYRIHGLGRQH